MGSVVLFIVVCAVTVRYGRRWWRNRQWEQAEAKARIRVTATLNRPRDFSPEEVKAAEAVVAGEQALKKFDRLGVLSKRTYPKNGFDWEGAMREAKAVQEKYEAEQAAKIVRAEQITRVAYKSDLKPKPQPQPKPVSAPPVSTPVMVAPKPKVKPHEFVLDGYDLYKAQEFFPELGLKRGRYVRIEEDPE